MKKIMKRTPAKATTSNPNYSGIMDKIKPVASQELYLAALFYGRAGSGKTTLACTFPGPVLVLDVREKGTDSVVGVPGVDSLPIENWDEFEQVYWFLKSGNHKYKTVVVDAVTGLQDLAITNSLEKAGKSDGIISKQMWGSAAGKLKSWIMDYRDLVDEKLHVVFLAHDRTSDGEEGDDGEITPSVGPRVMPSVASILNASVKMAGNTFVRETSTKVGLKVKRDTQYCLRIGPHAYYFTKIRQPKGSFTPDIVEDPSYDKLVSLMKGDFKKPEPKALVTRKLNKR